VKFPVSAVEPWLEERGYLVRHNRAADAVGPDIGRAGGAANAPAPDTRG
jgi:hypothetical protein